MTSSDYKAAYQRQKKAREQADMLLENRSRELFESNESLRLAYEKLRSQKEQIFHQEKLASIGQLSAGVAHEINNPAAYVKSNLNSMARYLDGLLGYIDALESSVSLKEPLTPDIDALRKKHDIANIRDDVHEIVSDSLEGVSRIESITQDLKSFSRPDSECGELFSLNSCIKSALKLVVSEVKYKADLVLELGDIPELFGFPGAAGQVFINLVMNASHAMEDHGKITVATQRVGKEIKATVEDTGKGIEPDVINKIFDPFFTTKDAESGTGLGLSISHGIVKKMGGRMLVESEVGKGTLFSLFLPLPNT